MAMTRTYNALRSVGIDEAHALAAADELASDEGRFGKIETDLAVIKSELTIHRVAFGILIAMQATALYKLFS